MTSVLRSGARRFLAQAVEMEVTAFIAAHGDLEDDAGRRRVVRHGHHRERQVQTGIGPVAVRCPRVRDRGGSGEAGKIRFTSAILPPYLRRAKSIEELLPWLYLAETKDRAEKAFDFFLEAYGAKYDKATACLAKDRAGLLTFYDFPAEHWKHLRTTNPIESTFATVRLRTIKTKGCLSRTTALTMVFKLCQSAAKKRRRLDGSHRLAEIVEGVKFKDGEKLIERAA